MCNDIAEESMDGKTVDRQTEDMRERYPVNRDPDNIIPKIRNFCLDMDGTVYLDSTWIDGAKDFLAALTATGRKYCFMTNNSSKSSGIYVEKLLNMGLVIDPEKQLITSGHATVEYLKRQYPGRKIYLFGNPMVKMEFEKRGVLIDEEHPDVVVTSFCTSFHYRDLCRLCDLVREGLPYVATHPDYNCPTKTGFIPDIGSLTAYVAASTGRRPDKVVGKPEAEIIDYALEKLGGRREESCVVGDRLYTDVKSGVNNGLYGIFVLSGEAQLEDLPPSDVKPHLIFDSVKEMIPFL